MKLKNNKNNISKEREDKKKVIPNMKIKIESNNNENEPFQKGCVCIVYRTICVH
jgi:hypothetical protein